MDFIGLISLSIILTLQSVEPHHSRMNENENGLIERIKNKLTPEEFGALEKKYGKKRVVITGIGIVSPVGLDAPTTYQSLLDGKSGVREISLFDAENFPTKIAAQVEGFEPKRYFSKYTLGITSRLTQFALKAFDEAWSDSGLPFFPADASVVCGAGAEPFGELSQEIRNSPSSLLDYERSTSRKFLLITFMGAQATAIADKGGIRGNHKTVSTACSSGYTATGEAYHQISEGRSSCVVVGAGDTAISEIVNRVFISARATTTDPERNSHPSDAVRPFDVTRDSPCMGEGYAVLIMEELEAAKARNARIYAEINSYHQNTEIHRPYYTIDKSGDPWAECIRESCPEPPDVVFAHAPGHKMVDLIETTAFKSAWGDGAYSPIITSQKGALGSGLSSSPTIQLAVAVLSLYNRMIPGTINLKNIDPCFKGFNIIKKEKHKKIDSALVSNHGFGGINAGISLRRYYG